MDIINTIKTFDHDFDSRSPAQNCSGLVSSNTLDSIAGRHLLAADGASHCALMPCTWRDSRLLLFSNCYSFIKAVCCVLLVHIRPVFPHPCLRSRPQLPPAVALSLRPSLIEHKA